MQKSLNVFISYSHKDRALREELEVHLSSLKRQNIISSWHDGDIAPGTEWEAQILERLRTTQVILLLLSPDFIASDFCYSIEMKEAIARHDARDAYVIPILLRPTDWEGTPIAKLQMLPTNAKPVTGWPTHDDAFKDVIQGIRQVLKRLTAESTPNAFMHSSKRSDGDREETKQTGTNNIPHKKQHNSTPMPLGTLLCRYIGHSGHVTSVAWSPDGRRIASASKDGTLQVWNPDDAEPLFTLNASGHVISVAWLPDGKRIASTSKDGTVRVRNPDDREQSLTFNASGPVAWSPDGKRLASATKVGTLQVWNADGSGQPFTYKGHFTLLDPLGGTHSVAWSPDSTRVASAYKDGMIQVWNADGNGQPFIYKGHFNVAASDRFGDFAWSPDGKRIASAYVYKTVQVWNAGGGNQPFIYRGHSEYVSSLAWSPDGKRIASASMDGTVHVWNTDGSGQPFIYKGHFFTALSPLGSAHFVAWSPDGKRISSGSSDHTVQVWSAG